MAPGGRGQPQGAAGWTRGGRAIRKGWIVLGARRRPSDAAGRMSVRTDGSRRSSPAARRPWSSRARRAVR